MAERNTGNLASSHDWQPKPTLGKPNVGTLLESGGRSK